MDEHPVACSDRRCELTKAEVGEPVLCDVCQGGVEKLVASVCAHGAIVLYRLVHSDVPNGTQTVGRVQVTQESGGDA